MAKREPTLADRLLGIDVDALTSPVQKSMYRSFQSVLQGAKRFVLDDDAARYVNRVVRETPEVIGHAIDFAIKPHKDMWIEATAPYLTRMSFATYEEEINSKARIGFLFHNDSVVSAAYAPPTPDAGEILQFSKVIYLIGMPLSENDPGAEGRGDLTTEEIDVMYWGSAYRTVEAAGVLSAIREHMTFDTACARDPNVIRKACAAEYSAASHILACLLVLNKTSQHQHIKEVKPFPTMVRRKPSSLVSHSVIGLNLTPDPRTFVQTGYSAIGRRQHDVRGHFCTNKRAKTSFCNGLHDWQEIKPHIWQCDRCKGLKWWRKEHKRGDADKGIVTQEYKVTAERKQS